MLHNAVKMGPWEDARPQATTRHRLAYVGKTPGEVVRDSDAWHTPPQYVEAARAVMGSIDLDPFSSSDANAVIKAAYFFDKDRSALAQRWAPGSKAQQRKYPHGFNVWMNPPYSLGLIDKAIDRLLAAWEAHTVRQAIVLVNNSTETQWFKRLRLRSQAVCFPTFRIAFLAAGGQRISGATRGQAFFYLGTDEGARRFLEVFEAYGWIILL